MSFYLSHFKESKRVFVLFIFIDVFMVFSQIFNYLQQEEIKQKPRYAFN